MHRLPAFAALSLATALAAFAQPLTTMATFNGPNGAAPAYMTLVQGTDGNFYGTTSNGGIAGRGTVFRITPAGALTTLFQFDKPGGIHPNAGLVPAADGDFYGTTTNGGIHGFGTVFRITAEGALTTLHNFCTQNACADGGNPKGVLLQTADGAFYGTTDASPDEDPTTVFRMTPSGTLDTLHTFCPQEPCMGGNSPVAGVIQGRSGNFLRNHHGTIWDGFRDDSQRRPGDTLQLL